ncbi:MAG: thiamine pyrophosphate-dependent enzyme, partial [Candidatus Latescibacteria bacterium]|nr:thiamine pyrophosphate-dependent enzyme [Candidatus Latescibacterota bacterium]
MVEAVTASTPKETVKRTLKDYRSEVKPTWCPGCGDFGVLSALQRTLAERNLDPKDIVIVSGIGCSGRLPEFVNAYGLHVVHGRALPTAQGVKAANPDLTVIAVGGDGDGFAIGGGHVPHAVRRNQDITYVLMDNQVYGLTKGQPSPTTPTGMAA